MFSWAGDGLHISQRSSRLQCPCAKRILLQPLVCIHFYTQRQLRCHSISVVCSYSYLLCCCLRLAIFLGYPVGYRNLVSFHGSCLWSVWILCCLDKKSMPDVAVAERSPELLYLTHDRLQPFCRNPTVGAFWPPRYDDPAELRGDSLALGNQLVRADQTTYGGHLLVVRICFLADAERGSATKTHNQVAE